MPPKRPSELTSRVVPVRLRRDEQEGLEELRAKMRRRGEPELSNSETIRRVLERARRPKVASSRALETA